MAEMSSSDDEVVVVVEHLASGWFRTSTSEYEREPDEICGPLGKVCASLHA